MEENTSRVPIHLKPFECIHLCLGSVPSEKSFSMKERDEIAYFMANSTGPDQALVPVCQICVYIICIVPFARSDR